MNQTGNTRPGHRALYDETTGLPNTLLTRELLNRWITLAQRNDRIVAVLDLKVLAGTIADRESLDGAVSRLLTVVPALLYRTIRHSDFCGISEDGTFIITVGGLLSPGDANRVVARLLRELRRQAALEFGAMSLAGGVSLYPADGNDADSLLLSARKARNTATLNNTYFEFFSPQISQNIVQHTVLEDRLLLAIETGELTVRYRPQYGLTGNRRVESIEALVFWQHPELGMIPPGALVALAEDLGLSIKVGTFVLKQAVACHREWSGDIDHPPELLIYLPAPGFINQRFVNILREVLAESPVAPNTLLLGLSESSILQSPEKSASVLAAFTEMGIGLSLFGFGSGHASLAGLILYPIDTLTLDSALVRSGLLDDRARLMVETTMAVAQKLERRVTASGVQTPEQAAWLRSLGCNRAQGPLFGRPVAAEEIGRLLRTDARGA